jgi:lipopolysaccharide export system protein LptA
MIRPLPVLVLCLCLCLASRLAAQQNPLQPTEITCDHFESVSTDKEMTTLFVGNVVVTGTNLRITCERLEVISFRNGPKDQVVATENQFKSLIATGHVKIVQGDREATCGRAEVLPGEDRITLTDNPVVEDKGRNVTWMGDSLFMLRGERRVQGKNARIIGPPIKDLGFEKKDKEAPASQPKSSQ